MGKTLQLLRASKKEDSNEKVEEAILLLYRARSEFAELHREPAYSLATFSPAGALPGDPTEDKKKNIEQGLVALDDLLSRSIRSKNVDLQPGSYPKIGKSYYGLFINDPPRIGSLYELGLAIDCFRKILQIAHPKTTKSLARSGPAARHVFPQPYKYERNENLLTQLIELLR